jgi:dynein assembly factor 1
LKKVKVLDIQSNHIKFEDWEAFLEVLKQMDGLRCLYVQRNPFFGKVKCCKKVLINALPKICYINDRPVFPEDKRFAKAFCRGGLPEERIERKLFKKEEKQKSMDAVLNFRKMKARIAEEVRLELIEKGKLKERRRVDD